MLEGYSNQVIANKIKKPLSTVQRRTRRLLESGLIKHRYELDYQKLGYKKGLLHIYLNYGNPQELAEKMLSIKNILSTSIHIGNSDEVAEYACIDGNDFLEIMGEVKKLPGIKNVIWSEEVFLFKADSNKLLQTVKVNN